MQSLKARSENLPTERCLDVFLVPGAPEYTHRIGELKGVLYDASNALGPEHFEKKRSFARLSPETLGMLPHSS